jgi:large subunit ribosomal protein L7Ae
MPKKSAPKGAPKGATKGGKSAASQTAPARGVQKQKARTSKPVKKESPLIESRPRSFGIGGDIQPRRDLTRFVRWPKYIRLQRQKRVLLKRLKVPPVINQFSHTIDKSTAQQLFTFLEKYSPETKKQKKGRLLEAAKAEAKTEGAPATTAQSKRPQYVKFGLNHVTALVESKKAKLVVIAHDVDPIELVLWLPTLCRKKGIPYLIVKGKARLGKVVHQKTATALAVVAVDAKDHKDLALFIQKATDNFNERYSTHMKMEGGGIMGYKHNTKAAKDERRRTKEKKEQEKKQKQAQGQAPKAAPAAADPGTAAQ